MKLVNLHDDLGYDILNRKKSGETDSLKKLHLPKLKKGELYVNAVSCFFSGTESWQDMQEMVLEAKRQIVDSGANFLKRGSKIADDKLNLFITVEGMCGIDDDVEERIQWLNDHDVLISSLCWNEENALATGVKGNEEHGLSELGLRAIKKMNELSMILDVSHLNDKSMAQAIEASKLPVIATHSNARSLCNHPRNLTDDQLKTIISNGGLVGMNAARYFVDEDLDKQDVLHLAKHAYYIKELCGVEGIAIGFDYMDYLEGYNGAMTKGLESADVSQNFILALTKVGFKHEEIEKIAYGNALDFFSLYLDIK